ncbi:MULTISPECIES: porin [unclassified Candidatus Frackibacter]|uniref:porin n=1 Tax=unclassified Candidatus Frackibacter TaxID=2648818 RepID=UPI00088ACE69|nr:MULTISPECIES: porin [unclassified Candidatus Frackibacter]SDC08572.1 porin [Candidatus Frackibacter sp. WG11]SEM38230.1 porin [Candidatus Frackibacter sp. WG12]SFL43789.1 porin [Candidatus Frackibacter sp. WG13]
MKKFSLILTIALVVALALPAMAATKVTFNGNLEMENQYVDPNTDPNVGTVGKSLSSTYGDLDLYLNAKINDKVSAFTELDYSLQFDDSSDAAGLEGRVDQMWINVEDAFGPLALRVGRMNEAAANNLLYDIEEGANEFVRLAYTADNISAKSGYSGEGKDVFFAEGTVTNLGLIDGVTLNYIDYNAGYQGYTVKLDKKHSFGEASVLFGNVDAKINDSANVLDVNFVTDQLFPGITTSLEYATAEKGFVADQAVLDQDDSVFVDTAAALYRNDKVEVIKPGINFDLTDKLNIDFAYAMYDADKSTDEDEYLDLVASYDLAENTYIDVEYENHNYDGWQEDEEKITTTLGVDF